LVVLKVSTRRGDRTSCLGRPSGKVVAIEHARAHAVTKPWGVEDLRPWSNAGHDGNAIGEILYERTSNGAAIPALLLKLLFTSQPLSIQVHPDDAFAHAMGLANGKTEAWYVLTAAPDARVALGLRRRLTPQQLREAIDDDTIADLIVWHAVSANDVIFVPGRTIHAIGAGLIIAELQQRSDATFRLFDPGRQRELHIEDAIRVADTGPADFEMRPNQLTAERRLLVSNPHFVFERIDLAANSSWYLEAERETWLLVLSGSAVAGSYEVALGDALFAQLDRVEINADAGGMVGLVAYTGSSPISHLLQRLTRPGPIDAERTRELPMPSPLVETKAAPGNAPRNGRLETIK
jgi:mannose-6-phosphate isomerase